MKIIKPSLQELFRDNAVVFIQSKTLEASGSNPSVAIYLFQLVQLPRPSSATWWWHRDLSHRDLRRMQLGLHM